MPSIILGDVPEEVHKRLKARALQHHRSMTKEAVHILEQELMAHSPLQLPSVVDLDRPINTALIDAAVEEGRE